MNINGVELSDEQSKLIRDAINDAVGYLHTELANACTAPYRSSVQRRVDAAERILQIITEDAKCTATTAEE